MSDVRYLDWPFFEPRHAALQAELEAWAKANISQDPHGDVDDACRKLVKALGEGGWLRHAVAGTDHGGAGDSLDTRTLCLIRETLARHSGLADFAFAMQGLGSGAISLHGSTEQKQRYLQPVSRGEAIAAFALSEPEAGSDVAAMNCSARIDGDLVVLNGEKTWISNGGIADFYVVFARDHDGPAGVTTSGPSAAPRASRPSSSMPAPPASTSPRASMSSRRTRWRGWNSTTAASRWRSASATTGQGFKVAMRTLDVFRTSVAAAALGMARRALDEALQRATTRRMFEQLLSDFQLTQAKLAKMATTIDSAALLTYRAAWLRDRGQNVTREAAMAKMMATEGAQQVIDAAVQMFGGRGVVSEQPVERLYREIRALRIYEGATEVQQLIIAREMLKELKV